MRHLILLTAVAVLSLGFAPAPKLTPSKADLKALQGAWKMVHYKHEGTGVALGEVTTAATRLNFIYAGKVVTRWNAVLDATKSPKRLDLKGVGSAECVFGIYRMDADGWTFCCGTGPGEKNRPTTFKVGKGVALLMFKRKKP